MCIYDSAVDGDFFQSPYHPGVAIGNVFRAFPSQSNAG